MCMGVISGVAGKICVGWLTPRRIIPRRGGGQGDESGPATARKGNL